MVRFHVTNLMAKLKVTSRLEAVLGGSRQGFIEMPRSFVSTNRRPVGNDREAAQKAGADDR